MSGDGRAPYADVGAATRHLIHEACRVTKPKLTAADWKVLLAIIEHLTTWSRLSDEVFVAQIADTASIGQSTAGRSLRKLAGIPTLPLTYDSRRGPGRAPLVSLTLTDQHGSNSKGSETRPHNGNSSDTLTAQHDGKSTGPSLAKNAPLTDQHVDQHPRTREKNDDVLAALDDLNLTTAQRRRALNDPDPARVIAWAQQALAAGNPPEALFDYGISNHTWPNGHTPPDTRTELQKALHIAASLGRNLKGHPEDDVRDTIHYELERRPLSENERAQVIEHGLEVRRAALGRPAAAAPEMPRAEDEVAA